MSAAKITALESRVAELEAKVEALVASQNTTTGGSTKAKKEKVKRGPTAWSLFVKHVTSEMKAAQPDTKLKLPDIAAEAKKRKESGRYDEAHWKAEAAKLTSA